MKLNEQLIVKYLEDHVGEFISSWQLVSKTETCDKNLNELTAEELFELDKEVFNIGRKNDYLLSKDIIGMKSLDYHGISISRSSITTTTISKIN